MTPSENHINYAHLDYTEVSRKLREEYVAHQFKLLNFSEKLKRDISRHVKTEISKAMKELKDKPKKKSQS